MTEPPASTDRLLAITPQGLAGALRRGEDYLFDYDVAAPADAEICLGMPRRREQYRDRALFPIFQMNLPEGYVLEQLRLRFAKTVRLDPMLLLAMTGGEAAIGRVRLRPPQGESASAPAMPLPALLAHQGSENLFRQLADTYLLRTGISGVQPKLLVPEQVELHGKATLATTELIVKSAGDGYPGLAVNEFLCMRVARLAGIPVPDFFLSEDHQRFVMRRFDRTAKGQALGFEDMAVLIGLGADSKYQGSYERVAKAIGLYCPPAYRPAALAQYFDQVALSCMVGNGDAHLKNFGLLYSYPGANDARLAPCYDIVCTTCYIPEDSLALTLAGSKSLFRARADILEFGQRACGLKDPAARITNLLRALDQVMQTERKLLDEVPGMAGQLQHGATLFRRLVAR